MSAKLDRDQLVDLYHGWGMTQDEIATTLGVTQKTVWGAMKRYGISARTAAKRDQSGPKNHMWKGDAASYKAFHHRMTSRFGQPQECSVCGTTDASRAYDWANLSGDYADLDDYARMCRSCHWKYDNRVDNLRTKEVAR